MAQTRHVLPALALGLGMGLGAGPACAQAAASPVRPYYDFVHWVAMGRSDLALEQFAPDAVVIAGVGCPAIDPCVGHEAIRRRYLDPMVAGQLPLPVVDQRFDGRRLRAGDAGAPLSRRWVLDFAADRITALAPEPLPTALSASAALSRP